MFSDKPRRRADVLGLAIPTTSTTIDLASHRRRLPRPVPNAGIVRATHLDGGRVSCEPSWESRGQIMDLASKVLTCGNAATDD
jgi:hypothetical protein